MDEETPADEIGIAAFSLCVLWEKFGPKSQKEEASQEEGDSSEQNDMALPTESSNDIKIRV